MRFKFLRIVCVHVILLLGSSFPALSAPSDPTGSVSVEVNAIPEIYAETVEQGLNQCRDWANFIGNGVQQEQLRSCGFRRQKCFNTVEINFPYRTMRHRRPSLDPARVACFDICMETLKIILGECVPCRISCYNKAVREYNECNSSGESGEFCVAKFDETYNSCINQCEPEDPEWLEQLREKGGVID
jgi:hypothetical protein